MSHQKEVQTSQSHKMNGRVNKEESEEFLDRVDEITQRVHDILEGKADVIEEEARLQEEIKLKEVKKEIRQREAAERVAKGIKGKGYKGNFKTFCKGCHTEYHHAEILTCNNCGRDTTTHEVSNV